MAQRSVKTSGFLKTACFLLLSVAFVPASKAEEACPFAELDESVLYGISFTSWDDCMKACRAEKLGTIVYDSLIEEVLPALMNIAEATDSLRKIPGKVDTLLSAMDWGGLRKSKFLAVLSQNPNNAPALAFRFTSEDSSKIYTDLAGLMKSIEKTTGGLAVWDQEGETGALLASDSAESATSEESGNPETEEGNDLEAEEEDSLEVILQITHINNSVWIHFTDAVPEMKEASSLDPQDPVQQLWKKLPPTTLLSVMVNFDAVGRLLEDTAKEVFEEMRADSQRTAASSLALDATMEKMLQADPETLEKLMQVQRDFNDLVPEPTLQVYEKIAQRVFTLLREQGVYMQGISTHPKGTETVSLWQPKENSEGAGLFATSEIPSRFLGILEGDPLGAGVQALPDLKRIYQLLMSILEEFPETKEVLQSWKEIQTSLAFSVENDLLTGLGREMAWITKDVKGKVSLFQPASSEFLVGWSLADLDAAKRSRKKLEEFARSNGFVYSSTKIADASFSLFNTGILGNAVWGIVEDPPLFVLSTCKSGKDTANFINTLKNPQPAQLKDHVAWPSIAPVWSDMATGIKISKVSAQISQILDQLKSSQIMMAMMGKAGEMALPWVRLGINLLENITIPDYEFTIKTNDGGIRMGRTLVLYPEVQVESEK